MSEHRRKPPQPQGGGRAAARRAGQQPSGRRAAPTHNAAAGSGATSHGEERPYGGRAAARRAAQRGGSRRRASDPGAGGAGRGGRGGGRRAAGGGRGRGSGGDGRPAKKRFIDYPRAGKSGFRRWVPSWKLVTGTFLFFFAVLLGAVGIGLWLVQVPTAQAASQTQKNVYYWADGKQMVVSGGGDLNRQIVPLSKIPKSMQNAVISAENASFYDDSGVDPMGIARAVVNMAKGGATQSGSTITQQYVKNTYLDQSQTITRKVKELFISVKVGLDMDKDDILAGYLNTAYYGRGAYGCQAAARAYYDRDCEDLTASQSAFLASTLNGPNLYDPNGGYGAVATKEANTKRAKARWEWILRREVAVNRMSKSEAQKWIDKKFPMPRDPKVATNKQGQIGYLTDLADNYIVANTGISKSQLDKGGYQIRTTFDRKKISELTRAVEKVTKENIKPKERDVDKYVQFGGASVEPKTGKIVAIYGGKDALEHYRNNADYTGVQVGSTFKPFVLAAAMTNGVRDPEGPRDQPDSERTLVSPKSVYNGDNKVTLRDYDGTVWHDKDGREWHQRNDGDEDKGPISLRTAMQFSVNTPYIQLGMDVGTDKVRDAALAAGPQQGAARLDHPDVLARYLGTQRHPARRCVRDLRGQRRAGRAVLGRAGRGQGRHRLRPQEGRRTQAGIRFERGEQRHRRPGERGPARHRQLGADRPAGRGQDRNHRREQVGLVLRLHPAAVHRDRHVAGQRPGQEPEVPVHARCGRPEDDPRCVVPGGDLGRLHARRPEGRAGQGLPRGHPDRSEDLR
ncbi:membrane peptidoglycan carboxypeptidase [Streptomyces demainii]|uniref:Membrane peptidoglycan carboxypeptidase n=1 Tax=Streptomyces demainii TaxID=588122 RepID=A0ABT9KJX3_9ACTN|nr:membrane peptidoglycan carboxypeptidase [Streptomyces demainii]